MYVNSFRALTVSAPSDSRKTDKPYIKSRSGGRPCKLISVGLAQWGRDSWRVIKTVC